MKCMKSFLKIKHDKIEESPHHWKNEEHKSTRQRFRFSILDVRLSMFVNRTTKND